MKDETVGAENSPLDDFDLDSFLRDNNFLTGGDKKDAENNAKQADKRPARRVTPRRPTSSKTEDTTKATKAIKAEKADGEDSQTASNSQAASNSRAVSDRARAKETAAATGSSRAKSTRKADAADPDVSVKSADPNATMSYAALGEDFPELPFVESARFDDDAKSKTQKSSKTSRTRAYPATTTSDVDDFGTDASAKKPRSRSTSTSTSTSAFTPTSASGAASPSSAASALSAADSDSALTRSVGDARTAAGAASSIADRTRAAASSGTRRSQSATAAEAAGTSVAELPRKRQSSASPLPALSSTSSTSSSPTRRPSGAEATSRGRMNSRQAQRSAALANPQDFQQARFTDSGYRIRGGGTRHYRPNPLLVGLVAVVVIAGIVLLSVGLRNAFEALLVEKTEVSVVTLTPSETREAIDSQMPHMFDYRDSGVESAYASFVEAGWNVVIDPRASSNNPDKSAAGSEIIHLSPGIDQTILDHGYYQGEFDAYNFDELQQSFNGAWMFDISRGDMGFYLQLEYINFASASLSDELERLRASQGLADENAVIDSQEVDDYGNNRIRGYSVIDEVTYYWELVGISFEEYYGGQDRRSLSETSVFVKCRIANFDFYGVSTPPSGNDGEGEGE
jgi:hypothetical protein